MSSNVSRKQRSAPFVDLFAIFDTLYSALPEDQPRRNRLFTDNGIHLTEDGYWGAALLICKRARSGSLRRLPACSSSGKTARSSIEEGTKSFSMSKKPLAACDSRWSIDSCRCLCRPTLREFRSRRSFRRRLWVDGSRTREIRAEDRRRRV